MCPVYWNVWDVGERGFFKLVQDIQTNTRAISDIYNLFKRLICVGTVVAVDKGYRVRVKFPDQDDVVSDWLLVVTRRAYQTQDCWLPVAGEQVLCLFLPFDGMTVGFVIGSLFSKSNMPPEIEGRHVVFEDGTEVSYQPSTKKMIVSGDGDLSVTMKNVSVSSESLNISSEAMTVETDALNVTSETTNVTSDMTNVTSEMTNVNGNVNILGNVAIEGELFTSNNITCGGSYLKV